jgi:hypothetical protein
VLGQEATFGQRCYIQRSIMERTMKLWQKQGFAVAVILIPMVSAGLTRHPIWALYWIFGICCVGLAVGIGMAFFRLIDNVSGKNRLGEARVIAKRIIPAHKEMQGKFLVNVPEQEVLDLSVDGQSVTYVAAPWLMERSLIDAVIPVQYVAGRWSKKITIKKYMYL